MAFNSISFLLFFIVVMGAHRLPLSWKTKKFNLLVASYLFYCAWDPVFVLLIWASTLVDWIVVKKMDRAQTPAGRRALLITSLAVNLGLLGYFKYGGFVLENVVGLAGLIGVEFHPAAPSIVLPVGISFYTFQTLSYTIDAYRGKLKPWNSFLDYALFVTFFPQLVAGPIVRASDFLPQCQTPKQASASQLGWGLFLLVIGLFQKDIIADLMLAPVVDQAFAAAATAGMITAWIGALGFSAQIFFDFAGYSTCAIGAGLCLGFVIPDNFRSPYAALGFADFWRRWHISLSTWLRDYLYISLGGNREGRARAYLNIVVTMLLGGLWHGASWRFVAWGGAHALFLVAERALRPSVAKTSFADTAVARGAYMLLTYLLVCVAWVFFRASDFTDALDIIGAMFMAGGDMSLGPLEVGIVTMVCVLLVATHWALRGTSLREVAGRIPWWLLGLAAGLMILTLIFQPGDKRAFIYFQF